MSDIKPCPFCGSTDTEMKGLKRYWAECFVCEATGPAESTRELAIEAWNRAGRDWVKAAPTITVPLAAGWEQTNTNFGVCNPASEPLPQLIFEGLPEGVTVRMERIGGSPITIAIGAKQ